MSKESAKQSYICSFCRKNRDEVELLIAGPEVNICNECVGICNEVIEDYKKRRPTIEIIEKFTEPQLVRFLLEDHGALHWTLDFMILGVFEQVVSLWTKEERLFDSLMIALEVQREELGLTSEQSPGDIDMLIIPQCDDKYLYDKIMAIEVKIVKPTLMKPSRNANSLGQTQINKLVRGGFPYVGLLHLVIPEPSPEYMLSEMTVESVNVPEDMPVPPARKEMFDLFPLSAGERQLGRLKKLQIPEFVGSNAFYLSIYAKDESGQTYPAVKGYSMRHLKEVKRNPNYSQETLELVEKHHKDFPNRYIKVNWFT